MDNEERQGKTEGAQEIKTNYKRIGPKRNLKARDYERYNKREKALNKTHQAVYMGQGQDKMEEHTRETDYKKENKK